MHQAEHGLRFPVTGSDGPSTGNLADAHALLTVAEGPETTKHVESRADRSVAGDRTTMEDTNQRIIAEFRANGGRVGGVLAGRDVLLLTTTGAKSGRWRTTPHVTVEVGMKTSDAVASVLTGEARERAWSLAVEAYPFLIEHQARTTRQIPIVALVQ